MLAEPPDALSLRAPARLHLGFLDPGGSLGRRFGSLGLVIDGFDTHLRVSAARRDEALASGTADPVQAERVAACLQLLRHYTGCVEPLHVDVLAAPPAHAGFGSGTQFALALGRAFARWHGLELATPVLARWLGRGQRSGIGIAGFDHGGLIVDGGPDASGAAAPMLARVTLPDAWRVLIVQDRNCQGLSGTDERHAIAHLAPLAQPFAADICHQVLMRVLPGAATADFAAFAAGITHIQHVLGEHFAPAQGGAAYTSAEVGRLMAFAAATAEPAAAVGQSSWGPTGFAILPSQERAEAWVAAARGAGAVDAALALRIVAPSNVGACVVDQRRAATAS